MLGVKETVIVGFIEGLSVLVGAAEVDGVRVVSVSVGSRLTTDGEAVAVGPDD
jgi:hypothetical protein